MDKLSAVQVANMTPEEYDAWVKEINGPEEKSVNEIQTEKIVYRFNDETYEYIGEYSLQPDPVNPGKFLEPTNITTVKPLPEDTTKKIYWDPNANKWYYKEVIHGFTWYDKSTGMKGFDVNESNIFNHVKTVPPVEGIMKYNDETKKWEYNLDEIRSRYLMELNTEKYKVLSSPYESIYGTFNSINDILPILKDYFELLSSGVIEKASIRTYNNEFIEMDTDEVKDLYKTVIHDRENIMKTYWEVKDRVKKYSLDELESYFNVSELVNSSELPSKAKMQNFDHNKIMRSMLKMLTKHV